MGRDGAGGERKGWNGTGGERRVPKVDPSKKILDPPMGYYYLSHCMGQIIKLLASVCLSVTSPIYGHDSHSILMKLCTV